MESLADDLVGMLQGCSQVGNLRGYNFQSDNFQSDNLQSENLAGDEAGDRLILAEAIAFGPDLVAVRQGRWKMIARRDGFVLALFDLQGGLGETTDVQGANGEVVSRLQSVLSQWLDSGTGAGGGASSDESWDDLDDTVRQRLRDLGYSD